MKEAREDTAMEIVEDRPEYRDDLDPTLDETNEPDDPLVLIRIPDDATYGAEPLAAERGKILEARWRTTDHRGVGIYVVWSKAMNTWAGVKADRCYRWYGDPNTLPWRPLRDFTRREQ
jgi:hypothetical protein